MNPRTFSLSLFAAALSCSAMTLAAQTANDQFSISPVPTAATLPTAVPALVPYSGSVAGTDGKTLTGNVSITFQIFKDQQGGEPLFAETQSAVLDASGHYSVQLGSTLSSGLPTDLFATGEARWLEVQVAGHTAQPRVLLASVPYALKASDAATLGGLPASAFVLAGSKEAAALNSAPAGLSAEAANTASNVTTTGGTSGYLPVFTGASTVGDSILFSSATGIGVGDVPNSTAVFDVNGKSIWRGLLNISRAGNATAAGGFDSYPLFFQASSYNSATKAGTLPEFQLQAEPTGVNTATPGGTFNLLYNANGGTPTETGLSINANGTINFVPGQTFPGAAGSGTITGVAAGAGLTGGGTTGNVTLSIDTTKVPLLAAKTNTFTGSQTIGGTLTVAGSESVTGNLAVGGTVTQGALQATTGTFSGALQTAGAVLPATGSAAFASGLNSYPIDLHSSVYGYFDPLPITTDFRLQAESSYNGTYGYDSNSLNLLFGSTTTPLGETGFSIASNGALNTPQLNAAKGMVSQPAGTIANPVMIVQADDDGVSRTAAQQLVVQGASIPGQQLLIGYITDANTNSNGGLATIQATWNGYVNTALALQPNGGCVCIRTGLNGALAYQADPLVVGQGQGLAVADGWATYSSRRFKTDIQTLTGALDKVERLRGVSYTLKKTGKREIGVIAEEVGKVVPEVVQYEENGVDAKSVDYTRLTALLIEATKQQQAMIAKQGAELTTAMRQIKLQQTQMRKQAASLRALHAQVQDVAKVNAQMSSAQPLLLAAR